MVCGVWDRTEKEQEAGRAEGGSVRTTEWLDAMKRRDTAVTMAL